MKSQLTKVFAVLALAGFLTACADMGSSSGGGGHSGGGHSHFSGVSK